MNDDEPDPLDQHTLRIGGWAAAVWIAALVTIACVYWVIGW